MSFADSLRRAALKSVGPVSALAAAAAGALAAAAFSVPQASWFVLVSLAVLFGLAAGRGSKKEGFLLGWLWGLAFFGVGLRWCYDSIHVHGGLPAAAAAA